MENKTVVRVGVTPFAGSTADCVLEAKEPKDILEVCNEQRAGYAAVLFQFLATLLADKFEFQLIPLNSSYDDALLALADSFARNETDMSLDIWFYNREKPSFGFGIPLMSIHSVFLTSHPRVSSLKAWYLTSAFSIECLLLISVAAVCISAVFFISKYFCMQTNTNMTMNSYFREALPIVFALLKHLLNQGVANKRIATHLIPVYFGWVLSCVAVVVMFNAQMKTEMTTISEPLFRDLASFAAEMRLGHGRMVQLDGYTHILSAIASGDVSVKHNFSQEIVRNLRLAFEQYPPLKLKTYQEIETALIDDPQLIYVAYELEGLVMSRNIQKVMTIDDDREIPLPIGWLFREGFQAKRHMRQTIQRISDWAPGILHQNNYSNNIFEGLKHQPSREQAFSALPLHYFSYIFRSLMFGYLAGLFSYVIEYSGLYTAPVSKKYSISTSENYVVSSI